MDNDNEKRREPSDGIDEHLNNRLMRDPKRGVLGGVLAGVADYTHINSVVLRLVFIFLFLFGGAFVIMMGVYLLAWLLMPQKREDSIVSAKTVSAESTTVPTSDSSLSKGLKLGCLGIGSAVAFVILIFALLLVVPSIYLSDFINIFSDSAIGDFDTITFDIQYHPDIPQLIIGALIVFVMPIWYLVLRLRKTNEERAAESRSLFWILLLVWIAGIFVIISSLTNNREDFEQADVDYSFFNVNFEQNKI